VNVKQIDFSWKTRDGIDIQAVEWLPEDAPKAIITLVHGLGEHALRYQHVAQKFTDKGYILFGFDLRGHGRSSGPRGHAPSYDALMDDIQRSLDQARSRHPGLPVFLYGHSLGGNLVLYSSLTRQPEVKGAIVTSPGLGTATPVNGVTLFLGNILYKLVPTFKFDNSLDRSGMARDPEVEKKYTADPLVHPFISSRLGLDMLANGMFILENPTKIHSPLLLMQGSADRLVSPELTRKFAENAPKNLVTYKEWEGFYHELHNEPEKDEVIQVMTDWLTARLG
jgi:alpha-beta hydrolase superfamily lysophospholipase